MNKEETIKRYGEAEYARRLEQKRVRYKENPEKARAYYEAHREEAKARSKKWQEEHLEEAKADQKRYKEENPEKIKANNQEANRKGGKYYAKKLEYMRTGIPGEKCRIRVKHGNRYRPYKDIIAPGSQLHHEWVPKTAEYKGVVLVEAEAEAHMHGFVDVIEILDGKITLLTEEEVKKGKKICQKY